MLRRNASRVLVFRSSGQRSSNSIFTESTSFGVPALIRRRLSWASIFSFGAARARGGKKNSAGAKTRNFGAREAPRPPWVAMQGASRLPKRAPHAFRNRNRTPPSRRRGDDDETKTRLHRGSKGGRGSINSVDEEAERRRHDRHARHDRLSSPLRPLVISGCASG